DHHGRRAARAPSRASGPLPRGRDRGRVSRHDTDVERADVDAELERVRRDNRANDSVAQSLFDFAPALRQITAAIPSNPSLAGPRTLLEIVLEVRRQDLRRQAALREDDQLEVPLEKLRRDA